MKTKQILVLIFLIVVTACTNQMTYKELEDPLIYSGPLGGANILNASVYTFETSSIQKRMDFILDEVDKFINFEFNLECQDQTNLEIYINKRQAYSSDTTCNKMVEFSFPPDKLNKESNDILFISSDDCILNNVNYYFDEIENKEVFSQKIELSKKYSKIIVSSYPDYFIKKSDSLSLEFYLPNLNNDVELEVFITMKDNRKLKVSVNNNELSSITKSGLKTIKIPKNILQNNNEIVLVNQIN